MMWPSRRAAHWASAFAGGSKKGILLWYFRKGLRQCRRISAAFAWMLSMLPFRPPARSIPLEFGEPRLYFHWAGRCSGSGSLTGAGTQCDREALLRIEERESARSLNMPASTLGIIIRFAACFLLGSIPFAVLAMMGTGIDIRNVGSGNPGFNNVLRVNKWRAVVTLIGDMGKGYFAVWLVSHGAPGAALGWLFGFGAILGHCFSPFLKFNGGKGIATWRASCCASIRFGRLSPWDFLL